MRANAIFGPPPLLGADSKSSSHLSAQARGIEQLSEGSTNNHPARSGRGKTRAKAGPKAGGSTRSKAGDVGKALRSVYDNTLREDVPSDFLDLLGKLT